MIATPRGAVERLSIGGNRFYLVPGSSEPYPSVTSVLSVLNKSQLNAWAVRQAAGALLERLQGEPTLLERTRSDSTAAAEVVSAACSSASTIADEAASVGTQAHQAIDDAILVDAQARAALRQRVHDRTVLNVLDGFELFERQSAIALRHSEVVVWSHRHKFAGTIDAIGALPSGELVALDWKTSNALRDVYALQLAAYTLAWNEMNGDAVAPIRNGIVVRFDKKRAHFEARQVAGMGESQATFLSALNLWRWRSKAPYDQVSSAVQNNGQK